MMTRSGQRIMCNDYRAPRHFALPSDNLAFASLGHRVGQRNRCFQGGASSYATILPRNLLRGCLGALRPSAPKSNVICELALNLGGPRLRI
jgi:hypothetical protein